MMFYYDNGWGISYADPRYAHGTEIMVVKHHKRLPQGFWEKLRAWWYGFKEYTVSNFARFGDLPKPLPVIPYQYDDEKSYALWEYLKPDEEKTLVNWVKELPNWCSLRTPKEVKDS